LSNKTDKEISDLLKKRPGKRKKRLLDLRNWRDRRKKRRRSMIGSRWRRLNKRSPAK
jgi:hypothetical protein